MKQQRIVSNGDDLCAEAGVDTLDELGGLLTGLKFEIIVRPDVGTGADLEVYAPTKGRGQGEYWPLSWPELQQSIFDFERLIEEEMDEFRESIEEPDKPPVALPRLTGSQRLHLIQGEPWKIRTRGLHGRCQEWPVLVRLYAHGTRRPAFVSVANAAADVGVPRAGQDQTEGPQHQFRGLRPLPPPSGSSACDRTEGRSHPATRARDSSQEDGVCSARRNCDRSQQPHGLA